jgi:pimeloyl-ACP methyl ester carboxylesterase
MVGPKQEEHQSTGAIQAEQGYILIEDGIRLFYQKAGRRGSALIIPGRFFIIDHLQELADNYTLISYDMRNRGRSDRVSDGSKITIQDDIKDLERVREHFGLDKFVAVGASYLGLMVILYAMEHPSSVERIVQFGPVPLIFGTEYAAHLMAGRADTGADPAEIERVRKLAEQGYGKTHPWSVTRPTLKSWAKVGATCRTNGLLTSIGIFNITLHPFRNWILRGKK